MPADKPLLGIALMLGFCVIAPLGDALAKVIGSAIGIGPLLFLRFAVQVALLSPIVLLGPRFTLSRRVLGVGLARSLLHVAAIALMVTALRHMPLADAVAIVFVLPFLNLALGRILLDEAIGRRRIFACSLGFLGTLLVIQPSFAALGPVALLPLGAALAFSLFMVLTRVFAAALGPVALQYVSGLCAVVLLIPALLVGTLVAAPELAWQPLNARLWMLALSLGALGTLAHLLMTYALRFAPSATVTPLQYVELPVAALLGYLFFSEWPNATATLGILLSMGAGLYVVIYEERARRRGLNRPSSEPPAMLRKARQTPHAAE